MASKAEQCPLCGFFSPSFRLFVSHLRLVHSTDSAFRVSCNVGECSQEFTSFSAFNSHVYRWHRAAIGLEHETAEDTIVSCSSPSLTSDQDISAADFDTYGAQDLDEENHQRAYDGASHRKTNAEFIMKHSEGRQLSQAALDDVIKGCRAICKQTLGTVKEIITVALSDIGIVDPGFTDMLSTIPDPFDGLESQYMRENFYKQHFNYVKPQKIPLGEPYYTDQFSGSKRRKVQKVDHFYYIPLLETLKTLLLNKDILSEVLNPHFAVSNGELRDYCDGLLYNSHPMFSTDRNALQIIAYYDELEVVNPIGSYVKKHKLGCLFFTLGNIKPKYRSTLKAINLVALAKYVNICKHGMDAFLSPFIDDLKVLYCDGIEVSVRSNKRTLFGGLLAFLADNLAAHAVGGFKESMSFALRICRTCMITTSESQHCFTESICQLRSPETHFIQCELLDGPLGSHYSTNFGINRRSILEDVPGFSVTLGIPHDIMHDLFEGVVPHELKLLLTHCVQVKKYFSIEFLNERIARFDFVTDRPTLIDTNLLRGTQKIRQSASQMIALSEYFPLIIADKIPEHDENFLAFLLLLKICKIALSPICTQDTIPYLSQLIEEKLCKFTELYPSMRLIPKFHFMIHYPTQIKNFGPLVNSWTMRLEAKLSFIKRCSQRSNFKNVTLTAAKKHQLWQCFKIHVQQLFFHCDFEQSPKKTVSELNSEADYIITEVCRLYPDTDGTENTGHPNWVKVQSAKYQAGTFLLLHYDIMAPKFGKIVDIVVIKDTILFSLQVFETRYFDTHFFAYNITPTSSFMALPFEALSSHPLHSKHSFVSRHVYIVPPFLY